MNANIRQNAKNAKITMETIQSGQRNELASATVVCGK
jgi:hypothetical protein